MRDILILIGCLIVSFAIIMVLLPILVICGIMLFFSSCGRRFEID
ncbi:MAG: hypothetical protein WC614_07025 [bacterium]